MFQRCSIFAVKSALGNRGKPILLGEGEFAQSPAAGEWTGGPSGAFLYSIPEDYSDEHQDDEGHQFAAVHRSLSGVKCVGGQAKEDDDEQREFFLHGVLGSLGARKSIHSCMLKRDYQCEDPAKLGVSEGTLFLPQRPLRNARRERREDLNRSKCSCGVSR